MKSVILLIAIIVFVNAGYEWTHPSKGKDLETTLKDERDETFIVFFHADKYKGDADMEASEKVAKGMKKDLKSSCDKYGLESGNDYTFIDVKIPLNPDGSEVDASKGFGKFLVTLAFEDGEPEEEEDDDAAEDEDGSGRRMLQEAEAEGEAEGEAEAEAEAEAESEAEGEAEGEAEAEAEAEAESEAEAEDGE